MKYVITGLVCFALAGTANAGIVAPIELPEPGMLGLIAAGATALIAIKMADE